MATPSHVAVIDFEVFLLMTMKLRMSTANKEGQLEAKLASHRLSLRDAELIHKRIVDALGNEATCFENIAKLLGVTGSGSASLKYHSVFWPGFEFNAIADADGRLESAGYSYTRRSSPNVRPPDELETWSVDITDFAEQFGPMKLRGKWPLFDKYLPAYEEYEFSWNGEDYGARFMWGLFLSSSIYWN